MRAVGLIIVGVALFCSAVSAQTTGFSYQGSLRNGGTPANGSHDFEFRLWDAASGGSQIGPVVSLSGVAVTNGVFSVTLDFGDQFPGTNRFLEIRVRTTGGGAFTALTPREPIRAVPYAVKSLNSDQLGGVSANQYVTTTTGGANFIQNTTNQQTGNFNISGNGTVGATLTGLNVNSIFEYRLAGQPFLNSVTSNSFFGLETGSANLGSANTYAGYRSGNAATSNASNNSFFGANAGRLNSNGLNNSFFGVGSGENNTFGGFNAFFGNNSGSANTFGNRNVFVGVTAGRDNTLGSDNTFVGGSTGQANISGNNNSFFGSVSGTGTTTGSNNSFFGRASGNLNVSGTFNTAIGDGANFGSGNLTFATAIGSGAIANSSNTVVLGRPADTVQIPGTLSVTGAITGTVSNAAQLGGLAASQYVVTTDPRMSDPRLPTPGSSNYIQNQQAAAQASTDFWISGRGSANIFNAGTQFQISGTRIIINPGIENLFVGVLAGGAGGSYNSFFGSLAGAVNTGDYNSFFGRGSGIANTSGLDNSFFGANAGQATTNGQRNSFVGSSSGFANTTGRLNSFFGYFAGLNNTVGVGNTVVGSFANFSASVNNATVIGNRAVVGASNALVLGSISGVNDCTPANDCDSVKVGIGTTTPEFRLDVVGRSRFRQNAGSGGPDETAGFWFFQNIPGLDQAFIGMENDFSVGIYGGNGGGWGLTMNTTTGIIKVNALGPGGSTQLCRNASNQISNCSSSVRYKDNVRDFRGGLDLVRRLRPVSFNWKADGKEDFGLVAEEVAEVEPLLASRNEKGEVEGVKYDRVGVVLVNAVNEQQQIEAQQKEIERLRAELAELRALVCAANPSAGICNR